MNSQPVLVRFDPAIGKATFRLPDGMTYSVGVHRRMDHHLVVVAGYMHFIRKQGKTPFDPVD